MKSYINMNSTVTTLGANYLVNTGYLNTISRLKVCTVASYRYYSTSKSDSQSSDLPPLPILTINNLENKDCIKSSRILLKDKGGIYSFINTRFFSSVTTSSDVDDLYSLLLKMTIIRRLVWFLIPDLLPDSLMLKDHFLLV